MDKLLLTVFLITSVVCVEIPSRYKKCSKSQKDFNDCLKAAVENAVHQGTAPGKEIGLPILEPLEVPSLTIGAGTGAVGFSQNYKDFKLRGMSKMACARVDMDFDKKTLTLDCSGPLVVLDFNYEINGKILLLPVYGEGPGSITIKNLRVVDEFALEEYEKKGQKRYRVTGQKLELVPEHIKFELKNLFNGDKALGDNINQVMNDNWPEVFADVKPSYEDAFGQIFTSIFNHVLEKVSADELFGDK